mmetsp:Transcript_39032/g.87572  ORF Transcript_39032/g.87572 Transcript_39032/m.87572 type:complete len:248 (+) Transcript_39032:57-800(+)
MAARTGPLSRRLWPLRRTRATVLPVTGRHWVGAEVGKMLRWPGACGSPVRGSPCRGSTRRSRARQAWLLAGTGRMLGDPEGHGHPPRRGPCLGTRRRRRRTLPERLRCQARCPRRVLDWGWRVLIRRLSVWRRRFEIWKLLDRCAPPRLPPRPMMVRCTATFPRWTRWRPRPAGASLGAVWTSAGSSCETPRTPPPPARGCSSAACSAPETRPTWRPGSGRARGWGRWRETWPAWRSSYHLIHSSFG